MGTKSFKKAPKIGAKASAKPAAAKTAEPRESVARTSKQTSAASRIDAKIASLGDWRGERLAEIRALIRKVDPDVVEEWKWMGTPVWSHEGMYVLANAHKDKVKLTFFHGAQLRDPKKLFNAGLEGNKWRAIDLREGDRIDEPALAALLREAIAYNTTHAVPKSKGSRQRLLDAAKPKPGERPARAAAAKSAPSKPARASSKGAGSPATARKTSPASGEPKLLSGGNPQIPKGDGDAPVQAYIAAMPGWKRDVGRRLDALVVRLVPEVRKAVRWNSPFYGLEGQGWFLSYHCFTRYVKVVFLRGTSLRPLPPVESKDPNTRYFHIHEHDPIDEDLLTRWIEQAARLPGDPFF